MAECGPFRGKAQPGERVVGAADNAALLARLTSAEAKPRVEPRVLQAIAAKAARFWSGS